MIRRPLVNVAQSVHQRLFAHAQKEARLFNELLQHYSKKKISLADVAKVLREFLLPPTDALVTERVFKMRWSRAGTWTE